MIRLPVIRWIGAFGPFCCAAVIAAEPGTTATEWRDDAANLEIVADLNQAYRRLPFSREFEGVLDQSPFACEWSVGPNLPVAWKGGVAGVIDGRIILAGGLWMPERLNLTSAFDPGTGAYAELPPPPLTPEYTQGVCDGTSLYVLSGRGAGPHVLRLSRTGDQRWQWSEMTPLPEVEGRGRWLATAAIDPGRYLYLLAGTPTGAPSEVGEKPQLIDYRLPLDREDAEWERIAPYPGGARSLVMGAVVNRHLYVFGGSVNDQEMRAIHVELSTNYGLRAPYNGVPNYRDAYRYDPVSDSWTGLRSTPFPVIAGSAVAVDDRHILLMGTADLPTFRVGKSQEDVGIRVKGGASQSHWRGYGDRILCYHVDEDNYSHVGVMPYGVATSHWVLFDDRLYSFGGEPAHGFNLNTETVLQIGTVKSRAPDVVSVQSGLPADAAVVDELGSDGVTVYQHDQTLWLVPDPAAVKRQSLEIPRLSAPIDSLRWQEHPEHPLEFAPEPQRWRFSWKSAPSSQPIIEVNFDTPPVLPGAAPIAAPTGDGSVMLHAYQADTHGEKLRFEPQPHKNTVGYWTVPTDYADWQLQIDRPGSFAVAVLQGCGAGQGGSQARLTLRQDAQIRAELSFGTVDTGHFQNFRWVHLGAVHVPEAGRYQLRIEPGRIAKAALFDVRAVHLIRQATGDR